MITSKTRSFLCCPESKTNWPPAGPLKYLRGVFSVQPLKYFPQGIILLSVHQKLTACRLVIHIVTKRTVDFTTRTSGIQPKVSSSFLTPPPTTSFPFLPNHYPFHPSFPIPFPPRPPFSSLWPFWQRCRCCHADGILSHSSNDCGMVGGGGGEGRSRNGWCVGGSTSMATNKPLPLPSSWPNQRWQGQYSGAHTSAQHTHSNTHRERGVHTGMW